MQNTAKPLISVIMPVYNTERYLTEAIESVVNQTFENWELICVDDGSTDASLDVLRRFAKNDSRIKVVAQPHIGTASAARNKALEYTTGEYIAMLDSDDKYTSDTLIIIQKRIEETSADYILFNTCFCSADLQEIKKELKGLNGDTSVVISGRTAFIESLDWKIGGCGAIHKNIIKKFKYNETGRNGDELSTRIFFMNSETVAFSEAKYLYRFYSDSMIREFSAKRFYTLDTDLNLLRILNANEWAKHILPSFAKRYFSSIFFTMVFYFKNEAKLSNEEKNNVKKYIHMHYVASKSFSLNRQCFTSKLKFVILMLSFKYHPIFLLMTYLASCKK